MRLETTAIPKVKWWPLQRVQVEFYKILIYKQRRAKRLWTGHLVSRAIPRGRLLLC